MEGEEGKACREGGKERGRYVGRDVCKEGGGGRGGGNVCREGLS